MSANPYDCWLTPPCAALALRWWLTYRDLGLEPWLDPFAGPGSLVSWGVPLGREQFGFELDTRWERELRACVNAYSFRVGRDSFALDWSVRGQVPHIISNPPFSRTLDAVERARDHAFNRQRWACLLMRTDWWQHPNRSRMRPDHMLLLEWRPVFGLNRHGKFGTDYAGYAWCVWVPIATGECRVEWLARPAVPKELVAEHRRLARLAHQMGHEAPGATP